VNTVGAIGFLVFAFVVLGFIYFLTARVQLLLNHAEELVDRATPEPSMSWYKQLKAEWLAEYEGRAVDEPEPITQPIQVGPPTVPTEAVIGDEWEQRQKAMYDEAMANIQGKVATHVPSDDHAGEA